MPELTAKNLTRCNFSALSNNPDGFHQAALRSRVLGQMRGSFFSVISACRLREWGMALGMRLLKLNAQLRQLPLFKLCDRDAAPAFSAPNLCGRHQLQDRAFPKARARVGAEHKTTRITVSRTGKG